jgi:membrane associated rhomboid family serine protease
MFPIRDAVPSRARPVVSASLVAALALLTITSAVAPASPLGPLPSMNPLGGVDIPGADEWLLMGLSLIRPWGWFQGIVSGIVLWIFGRTVEDRLGPGRFIAVYLGCAALAAAATMTAGAGEVTDIVLLPGAVAAVVGAHTALFPRGRILVLVPVSHGLEVDDVPAQLVSGIWLASQIAHSLTQSLVQAGWTPPLAIIQLAVGLLSGAGAARILRRPERMRVEWWNH